MRVSGKIDGHCNRFALFVPADEGEYVGICRTAIDPGETAVVVV